MARYKLQPLGAPKYTTTLLGSDPSDSENYSIQSIIDFITANVDGINQNNTIRFFTTITASGKGIANAVVAFNATSYLSVSDEENIIVSVRRSDVNRSSTKTVQALLYDFYWLKTGKGTYGVNGTNVITTANLFYHGTTEEIYIETINNLPPVIYELSYEEIDVNDVSTFVNNAASFLIDSNADYFFLVREFEIGPGGFPSGTGNVQYYRFIGANGTYGLGLDQTTLADFVELSTNENQTTETTLLSLPEVWDNEITEDMLGHALTVVSNSNEPPGQGARFRPVLTSKDVFRANAVVWYGVTYIPNNTGLQYFVFCNKAIVNQKDYINFASNIITHPDGHGTYDRIDYVVYRMASDFNSATIVLIEGIPLLNPVEPNLDLTREAIIYQKRVLTTQTIDIDVTTDIVYNENSEWTNITQFTGSDLVSEADPFNGTYNFEVPSIGITSQLSLWERGSLTNFVTDNSFKFSIINRDLVSPLRNTLFEFKFINSTTGEYFIKSADSFSLRNYGYLRTSANWQIISVPFSNFTSNSRNNTQYDSFSISIGNSNALGLDWIHVGGGIEVVPPAGIFVKKIIPTYGLSVDETNSEQPIISLDGTPFKSVTTGLPSVNYDEDSYTTGKKGFNEPNPEEDIDLVGSVKYDFTYSNGVIARTAFGGLNINSENGYPASGIKGILLIVYPAPGVDEDTAAMSSQFLQADASGIGSVNLITILGTQTNDALRYASFRSAKSESNDLTYFAGLDTLSPTAITGKATRSWLRNYEKGLGSGFDKEPYFLFKLDNITDGIVQDSYMTPHLFSIGANMFQLRGFGVGNRLTGYTGTDTLDRTGTAATVVGAATYNLQVTATGHLIERALYPDDVITKTTSATSAGANFTITNLMRTVIAADTGGTGVFNLVLPTAIGIAGQRFLIKNVGAGIKTVIFSLGQSADGATTKALNQYDTFEIESDGANYIIIYNFNDFSFTKTYWFDASDTATTATPITHGAGATNTYLTNNGAGTNTTSHNPNSNATLWNTSTNKFDFTSLKIGDTVEFRIDINLTNGAAQEVDLFMSIAEGTAAPYELNMNHAYYKTASTLANDTVLFRIYIGDENTRTGGARFRFASSDTATIVVNGWFYQITEV